MEILLICENIFYFIIMEKINWNVKRKKRSTSLFFYMQH